MHRGSPTYRLPAVAGEQETVQVVARTHRNAEVHIVRDGRPAPIGLVRRTAGSWAWEHTDGEQSSPIAPTSSAAARALADYHCAHKPKSRRISVRELLAPELVRQPAPGGDVARVARVRHVRRSAWGCGNAASPRAGCQHGAARGL